MKNDAMTTILNFVLATIVIIGVVCGYLTVHRTSIERGLRPIQAQVNMQENRMAALLSDVNNYNQAAKSPEISAMLQDVIKPPTTATHSSAK
jgi:hypothetical protein